MSTMNRKYDREFKIEAVKLATRGDKTIAQVARDLGINRNLLGRWKKQLNNDPSFAFPGKGFMKPADQELHRLKRELNDIREERDILKKALAIFSKKTK